MKDEMAFTNWLKLYYRYANDTIEKKLKHLYKWKGLCPKGQQLSKMDASGLLKLIETQKQHYTPQALNERIKALEQYFYFLLDNNSIKEHPLKNFRLLTPKPKLLQGFIEEQTLHHIYLNYPVTGHYKGQFDLYSHRNKIILGFIIYQALTEHCLESLHLQDVNLYTAQLNVPQGRSRLNGRKLQIEGVQMLELKAYIEDTREKILHYQNTQTTLLFPRAPLTRMSINLLSIKKKIRSFYPLKEIKQLRSSRIAIWMEDDNIRKVQYKAGFSSLMSLNKYNQKKLRNLTLAIEKYKPF